MDGLIQCVSEKVNGRIQKVPSRVQFRFGNSGTLQSRYALCIPRQQKGWIRIEVVPGQTPFLVSNTILKEMGAIIDPRNRQLRFLDHEHVVALHTCRKNLLCVDIGELLRVEQNGEGKEEIYHTKCRDEPTCRTQQRTDEEDVHDQGSTQDPQFLCMKKMTHTHVQNTPQEPQIHSSNPQNFYLRNQVTEKHPFAGDHKCLLRHEAQDLSRCRVVGRGRSGSHGHPDVHAGPRDQLQGTTGSEDPGSMGPAGNSLRKESREDIPSSVRGERWVPHADQESESRLTMASQLSELPERNVEAQESSTDSRSADHQTDSSHAEDQEARFSAGDTQQQSIRTRMGEDSNNPNIESEEKPSGDDSRDCFEQYDEHREEWREGGEASHADRHLTTRVGHRDPDSRRSVKHRKDAPKDSSGFQSQHSELLTEEQVLAIHEAMAKKVSEIQGGLSKLREKHPALGSHMQKETIHGRPVDLLEVYCSPESQLTHQMESYGKNCTSFYPEGRGFKNTRGYQQTMDLG